LDVDPAEHLGICLQAAAIRHVGGPRRLHVDDDFQRDIAANRAGLAALLSELERWLRQSLTLHNCIACCP
jgi:hypothetical protein